MMRIREENGAALVEFALILPVLLLILLGIIEFGIILYDKAIITNASREMAREGIVFTTDANDARDTRVKQKIFDSYGSLPITFGSDTLTLSDLTIDRSDPDYVRATVNFSYDFLYLPMPVINLSTSTIMRREVPGV
ncbi:MAG TPA: TadE/TadG family type IV pilus assembly protein [Desulfuromonadales bacterium]|nr:TadE/TadG family type IV pilus assembly protein [Desulfuromonadales bacterium]